MNIHKSQWFWCEQFHNFRGLINPSIGTAQVSFLQPLETPAMALSRVRRGTQPKTEPALKTRARLRQNRAEVARVAVTAQELWAGSLWISWREWWEFMSWPARRVLDHVWCCFDCSSGDFFISKKCRCNMGCLLVVMSVFYGESRCWLGTSSN